MVVVLWTGGYNPVIQVPIGRKENREMKIFRDLVLVVVLSLVLVSVGPSVSARRATCQSNCVLVGVYRVGTETNCVANGCVPIVPSNTRICSGAESDEWHGQGYCDVPSGMCVASFFECFPCRVP